MTVLAAGRLDAEALARVVDGERAAAGDAALTHAARHHGGVRGRAAARRQDALGDLHAGEVLGAGLDAHEHDVLAALGPLGGLFGGEDYAPDRRARGGAEAGRDHAPRGARVEGGVEQLVEPLRLLPRDRLGLVDQALVDEVDGDLDHRLAGALAGARLQHPEPPLLHRELDVLHVPEVALEALAGLGQFPLRLGHQLLEGVAGAGRGGQQRLRGADAGDDVLALRVDQVLAAEASLAGGGVAREDDAGRAVRAEVAEDHRLHVDGRPPVRGVAVELAVDGGARVLPGVEDRPDRTPELLPGVVGEGEASVRGDHRLELGDQLAQRSGVQLRVQLDAACVLLAFEPRLEGVFVRVGLGAHAEHHVAVHLHEATVGVVGEARAAGNGGRVPRRSRR